MSQLPVPPFGFDPAFERVIVYYCACRPRFWARVGQAVDYDGLGCEAAKIALQICGMIAKETGQGPSNTVLVIQRLTRIMNNGKITVDHIRMVSDYFDEAEEFGLPDEEAVMNELIPVLKRRMHQQAILQATNEFAQNKDMSGARSLLDRAERIGSQAVLSATRAGVHGFAEIDAVNNLARLPTGILELDISLNGGLPRGQIGVAIGDSGGGKSQFLISQAAEGVRRRLFVGVVTLELPKYLQLARIYANLTGIPINLITDNADDRAECKRRISIMEPDIGVCVIEDFPPQATSVQDLIEWIDFQEQDIGEQMNLLVVDYADKMYDPSVRDGNEYRMMKLVYDSLRCDIAMKRGMWVWTASQAKRPSKDSAKRIDLEHVADSLHKVRSSDLVITLNPRDEGESLEYYVAKFRSGKGRFSVGPLPTDWSRGRSTPLTREWQQW